MSNKKHTFTYPFLLILSFGLALVFRGIEFYYVATEFNEKSLLSVLGQEFLGLLFDCSLIVLGMLGIYFFEKIAGLSNRKLALLYLSGILIFALIHSLLLTYFVRAQWPIGTMLYEHTFKEIFFTISTSGIPIQHYLLIAIVITIGVFFGYYKISRREKNWSLIFPKKATFLTVLPIFVMLLYFQNATIFTKNKSFYFYKESLRYLLHGDPLINIKFQEESVKSFQTYYPKSYVSIEFPLLHQPDTVNHLAAYFEEFEEQPNIVFLLIEGLNDDFIHDNNGILLMPFLNALKNKSLYWENCFTLGERSFAVVPSILGGLPYGKRSFMQLENYPRFFTLANVLKENNYQVSFNYGKALGFTQKMYFLSTSMLIIS